MANNNVPQGGAVFDEKKQTPARAETYEHVLGMFKDQSSQLEALAFCLLKEVEPKDGKNPEDEVNITAWRLAQIIYDMLSSTSLLNSSRDMLMGEAA